MRDLVYLLKLISISALRSYYFSFAALRGLCVLSTSVCALPAPHYPVRFRSPAPHCESPPDFLHVSAAPGSFLSFRSYADEGIGLNAKAPVISCPKSLLAKTTGPKA